MCNQTKYFRLRRLFLVYNFEDNLSNTDAIFLKILMRTTVLRIRKCTNCQNAANSDGFMDKINRLNGIYNAAKYEI